MFINIRKMENKDMKNGVFIQYQKGMTNVSAAIACSDFEIKYKRKQEFNDILGV